MAHAASSSSTVHAEPDGYADDHGHHVFDKTVLLRTFFALVFLTVLTVVLALFERGFVAAETFGFEFELPFSLPLGVLSVPVAMAIAGVKAFLVAAFFMGLKYEKGTNLLTFIASLIFLMFMFVLTFLDTSFRDTFDVQMSVPIDELEEEALRLEVRTQELEPRFQEQPLLGSPDSLLFESPEAESLPPAAPSEEPSATQ